MLAATVLSRAHAYVGSGFNKRLYIPEGKLCPKAN